MSNEEITDKIICELKKIAFADFNEISESMNDESHADFVREFARHGKYFPAISQIKAVKDGVEIKFYDKLKAIELLGKYVKQQGDDYAESDFDNLISVLQSKAGQIWKGGDTD